MAGHVLLTVFFLFTRVPCPGLRLGNGPLGVVTFLVACILIVFELMVISIQAYIFTILDGLLHRRAVHGHGGEEHEHEETPQHLHVSTRQSEEPRPNATA